jgi:hypothetical protein
MPMPQRLRRCHAEGAPMPRDNDQDGTPQGVFGAEWRKSTRSGDNGGACVEVARNLPRIVAVRDSKNPHGSVLTVEPAGWRAFIADVKAGRHDLT